MHGRLSRIVCAFFSAALLLSLLCTPAGAAQGQAGQVVSVALSQAGYTEGADEYTKYGQWYGIAKGYWCDMFVSWCASEAGVSREIFPYSSSCTAHINLFKKMGRYAVSASRGGTYIPQQGDVIFFYDPTLSPDGARATHVGLVLYTENGYVYTIEGNALPNRLDCSPLLLSSLREDDQEPPDYVTVNHYPLNAVQIHGYGTPDYADRTPLALSGFVDLGRHAGQSEIFRTLSDEGVMAGTSTHTFSPNHGMTRGDFLTAVMNLYGLSGWSAETQPFSDVPAESACYDAVMTARCAGIIQGTGDNTFQPDAYISGTAAQAILSAALSYAGLEDRTFSFSDGDLAYICGSYTIRADLAAALYTLLEDVPLPETFPSAITLNGEAVDWPALQVNGSCAVPLAVLQEQFPTLTLVEGAEEPALSPGETSSLPVPMAHSERVLLTEIVLGCEGAIDLVPSFVCQGTRYVLLRDAAAVLPLVVDWNGSTKTVALTIDPLEPQIS